MEATQREYPLRPRQVEYLPRVRMFGKDNQKAYRFHLVVYDRKLGDRFPDAYGPAISSFDRFLPPYVLVINLSFSRDQSTRSVAQRALDDLISWTLECQP